MGSMNCKHKRPKTLLHQLPEELIEEILLNLPAKSVLRFKCVSKQWRSLISSKQFIKRHLKKKLSTPDHHNLIVLNYPNTIVFDNNPNHINRSFRSCPLRSLLENSKITSFDHHPMEHICDQIPIIRSHHRRPYSNRSSNHIMMMTNDGNPYGDYLLEILGSCNGLILIAIDTINLFLWNPTTKQAKKVPPPTSANFSNDESWDIDDGFYAYGFGYDDVTEDYKIVYFLTSYRKPGKTVTTEMYSWRTNSWKKIENSDKGFMFYCSGRYRFMNGKFVNGKLHWVTPHPEEEDYGGWGIVAFDLAEEKYENVDRPQYFSNHTRTKPKLHSLGGYLSLTCFDENHSMEVWVMTKYGETESWIKFWTFSPKMNYGLPVGLGPLPLWLRIENGDIIVCFAASYGLCVVRYNGSNVLHTSQVVAKVDPCVGEVNFGTQIYVESLVSPFGDQQLRGQ